MKKIIFAILVFLAAVTVVHAQKTGDWAVGGRMGALFGFHSLADDVDDYYGGPSYDSLFNFNIAAFGAYTFRDNLSVQAELNIMVNQGIEIMSTDSEYSSVDIPVLIKWTFMRDPLILGVLGGPYLTIPVGDIETGGYNTNTEGVDLGLTAGLYAGYPLGPGRIVGDMRFILDISALEIRSGGYTMDMLYRRGLAFTAGYEISL